MAVRASDPVPAVPDKGATLTARTVGPSSRPRIRLGALVVLALGVLLVTDVPARAEPAEPVDPARTWGLEAVLGVGGQDVRAAWRPVTVTLAPEVPLRGRLLLAADRDGSRLVQSRDVEVTAGARKQWVLLVPPGTSARVQVVEDGSETVATVVPDRDPTDGFLVGVLGGLDPTELPGVTLPTTDQRAVPVVVGADVLDLGPRALSSLATLVVRQADLAELDPSHRDAVVQRVTHGATLVVLAATDPDLGLPWRAATSHGADGVQPAPGAWGARLDTLADRGGAADDPDAGTDVAAVAAGRGRVVVATGDAGTGALGAATAWEHLLQPASGLTAGAQEAAQGLPNRVEQAFGNAVGDPPSVGWLAGFFVLYVVVAGPVAGVVLSRRRRPEMAWVVLPVVTGLFAVAAFLGASGSRPQVGATGQVAAWLDGVGSDLAVGGVRAPTAGAHELVLPGTGWDVDSASWTGSARVDHGTDTTVALSLPGQSFGAVVAERPTDQAPPLDVEVALFADEARVEVTNIGDHPVDDLELRLATSSHDLAPSLPPGETLVRTVALPDELPHQRDPFGEEFMGGFQRERGPEALASLARWGMLDGSPGTAWVVGTVDGAAGPAVRSIDGAAPSQRGTVVAVGVTPPVTDDATTPFEVQRDLVAGTDETWQPTPQTLTGTGPATLRFRLPAEGDLDGLTLQLDRGCCGGGRQPVPAPFEERCGQLEVRDEATGDVLRVEDTCSAGLPCPPDAVVCEWGSDAGPVLEGRACFDGDRPCEQLEWTVEAQEGQGAPFVPAGPSGLEVWDHVDRRWVDSGELGPDATVTDLGPWVGPLGDVWVRVTGALEPFDMGPQGITGGLRGGGA